MVSLFDRARSGAGQWWFPFLVATLSGVNLFTLVLSAPTAACFIWGCVARPGGGWLYMALVNAAGTALGVAALMHVFEAYGKDAFAAQFPLLTNDEWGAKFESWHGAYGTAGVIGFSAMPIILHPIVFFGLVARIPSAQLLACIFAGRVVKYSVMGWCAHHATGALRFFGIDFDKVVGGASASGSGKSKSKGGADGPAGNERGFFFRNLYLIAALQWGVLAPLNLVKVLLNKVSPTARMWVPEASETCQKGCAIARMWATLFWSLQCCFAAAYVHVHYHREQTGLIKLGVMAKVAVGALLLKAFAEGVVKAPIGAAGALDWAMAVAFAAELASRKAKAKAKSA